MPSVNDSQIGPKTAVGITPFMRSAEMAEAALVAANSGRLAVSYQVALQQNIAEISAKPDLGDEYRGVVEIDHNVNPGNLDDIDNSEEAHPAEDSIEAVKHSYVGESLISPTENIPYPDKSPLLGSN